MPEAGASGGTAQVTINGKRYSFYGDLNIQPGGTVRTPIEDDEEGNYTTKTIPGTVEGTATTNPSLSIEEIRAIEDVEITCRHPNGKRYQHDLCYCQDVEPMDVKAGTVKIMLVTKGPMKEL